jgi:hypothetical protein
MGRQVGAVGRKLTTLEGVILQDPVKAVRFTLLTHDLARDREQNASDIANVQAQVDRQYDLMKWVIGTLAVGIIGVVSAVVVPALRGRQ